MMQTYRPLTLAIATDVATIKSILESGDDAEEGVHPAFYRTRTAAGTHRSAFPALADRDDASFNPEDALIERIDERRAAERALELKFRRRAVRAPDRYSAMAVEYGVTDRPAALDEFFCAGAGDCDGGYDCAASISDILILDEIGAGSDGPSRINGRRQRDVSEPFWRALRHLDRGRLRLRSLRNKSRPRRDKAARRALTE